MGDNDYLVSSATRERQVDPERTVSSCSAPSRSEIVHRVTGCSTPLVSCIMPTFNRPAFVALTLDYFRRQTYPNLELVVIDDGSGSVRDLIPHEDRFRYVHLPRRLILGEKRNLAVQHARGQIIVQWDDDDWYGPERVARQVAPILAGQADVTGVGIHWALSVMDLGLFRCLHRACHRSARELIHPGTLAYRRSLWGKTRYPPIRLAEDAGLLRRFSRGTRIMYIADEDLFVIVRHGENTWNSWSVRTNCSEWEPVEPARVIGEDWDKYVRLGHARLAQQAPNPVDPWATRAPSTNTAPNVCFVINLERSTDRAEHMRDELRRHWCGSPVEFFHGVDGSRLDTCKFRAAGLIRECAWMRQPLSPGELGCWLAHLFVLREIVRRRLRTALILEDDVRLVDHCREQLCSRLDELTLDHPHPDVVHLGCYEGHGSWAPKAPKLLLPGGFFRLGRQNRGCPGGYAYLVTLLGARKLLRRLCEGPIDQPQDEVVKEQSQRDLRVFCASPPLVQPSEHPSVAQTMRTTQEPLEAPLREYLDCLEAIAPRPWWGAARERIARLSVALTCPGEFPPIG